MFKEIINFIFPITCVICSTYISGQTGIRLCSSCRQKIKYIKPLYCQKCGLPLPDGGAHCYHCLHPEGKIYYEYLRGVCEYEGITKDLIHLFKYRGKEYLSRTLSGMLISYMRDEMVFNSVDIIVPVPLHWYKRFRRGYNQSELLSEETASFYKKPVVSDNIYRLRHTKPQVKLKRMDRLLNVRDAFGLKQPDVFKNKTVLVIDDVATTGETINQCAKLLKSAGAKKIYGLTVARGI